MWSSKRTPSYMGTILALSLIIGLQPGVDSLNILAIFPVNSHSHTAMGISLAKGLAARGHRVDMYSHFPLKNPPPNYIDHSLADTVPAAINNMSYEKVIKLQPSITTIKSLFDQIGNPSCALMELPIFKDLREKDVKNRPYDLVIVEVFAIDCYLAWGRHFNVPLVGVVTTFSVDWWDDSVGIPSNSAVFPRGGSGFRFPTNFWQRLVNTIVSNALVVTTHYFMSDQDVYVERVFGPGYPKVTELEKDVDLMIVNSHMSLEGIKPSVPVVVPVAGIHITDDDAKLPEDVQKWLDDSTAGCVYFSFGSMVTIETFPAPVLKAFYNAFEAIAPARVLWKIAKPELLPPGIPSNVMTQKWFHQNQVLKHPNMKAFVTHGGLMSTEEAVYHGVPMVGIPIFGDQHQNVNSFVQAGVSTKVPLTEFTKEKFTKALTDVLQNPDYRKNIQKMRNLFLDRPMSPLDTAIFWVEYVARHGKKILKSPLVDLAWYEKSPIDVYSFIGLTLFAIYYILKLSVKRCIELCKTNCKYSVTNTNKKSVKKEN